MEIVADMSQYVATAADADTVSICSVGVYGTKYVRDGQQQQPLPDSVEIVQGRSLTIPV